MNFTMIKKKNEAFVKQFCFDFLKISATLLFRGALNLLDYCICKLCEKGVQDGQSQLQSMWYVYS